MKHRVIVWSKEAMEAFEGLQKAIQACPLLFFLEDKGEIILETDASDYGIGAYLYQIVPGGDPETRPVAFMSRSLNSTERRWATIEKECCAIYESVKQWEYLLGGRFFTIRTDHKNLLYLNDPHISPKVVKWKLALMEFDFRIEYIKGEDNVVADCLSRIQRGEGNENDILQDIMQDDYEVTQSSRREKQSRGSRPRHTILARIRGIRQTETESSSTTLDREVQVAIQSGQPLRPAAHHENDVLREDSPQMQHTTNQKCP